MLKDDGLLLSCGTAGPNSRPGAAVASGPELAALCAEELRKRLPLLQAAVRAEDAAAVRTEAHAMRGVAANFGLDDLARSLLAMEQATRHGDRERLGAMLRDLPAQLDAALALLPGRPA